MADPTKVLFVDDDSLLRKTWSAILNNEGFLVKDASTVADGLALITSEPFDVLIADLNIGAPGDGFTVVSAMRRVHPQAVTLILTGYPAFQAALRAIHEQVDDFLTKPTDPDKVIDRIRQNLTRRKKPADVVLQRLPEIIATNRSAIVEEWYRQVENDPELKEIKMSREERIDHLPDMLDELVRPLAADVRASSLDSAAKHGLRRRKQGYKPGMLLQEARILHGVVANCTQEHLLSVDVSNVLPDLVDVDDKIHAMSRYSLEAFLAADEISDAA